VSQEAADAYNRKEIGNILRAFRAIDEEAKKEAQEAGGALAEFFQSKVIDKAFTRTKSAVVAQQTALGSRVKKSSKIGELSIGFAAQTFSGGGSTKELWGGIEFGSKNFKQFPTWNPRGYFIYPALRENQSYLVKQWEEAFSRILKKYGDN
jgi:hypothetical protein